VTKAKKDVPSEKMEAASFRDMALIEPIQEALEKIGYEVPTPIQVKTITHLLEGRDVLGQAQTGTGKTAAFALPLLSRLDVAAREPQILVLTPTRELAIQVAESFQQYASCMPGVNVLAVYGGQDYLAQIRPLRRGVHVVVGTPGRVMDHLRRGTLKLETLRAVVLDEADEMLNMGFLEDVEWIMEHIPEERQVALFCATMPEAVRRIAQKSLRDPEEVRLLLKTNTVATLNQRYWLVSGFNKLDTLSRILECETCDGILIFVKTKTGTVELVEQLESRGFTAEALNGDMKQTQREHAVNRFKSGKLDILVATDVAARGLDVDRISHVINYDIPTDTETYIHRVGRTGRAGRSGEAILFVAPREKHKLRIIEAATKQRITQMEIPGADEVNAVRTRRFKQRIADAIEAGGDETYRQIIDEFCAENCADHLAVAAALAKLLQGDRPFLLDKKPETESWMKPEAPRAKRGHEREEGEFEPHGAKKERDYKRKEDRDAGPKRRGSLKADPAVKTEYFRMEVGRDHGVRAGNIVGAIANEAGLDSTYINKIKIHKDYSTVELPAGMPKKIMQILQQARVMNRPLDIKKISSPDVEYSDTKRREYKSRDDRKTSDRGAADYFDKKSTKNRIKKMPLPPAKKQRRATGRRKRSSAGHNRSR